MSNLEKRMTRQIRVYEESAKLIEEVVKRSKTKTTFADIVEDVLRKTYPEAYAVILQTSEDISQALDKDET